MSIARAYGATAILFFAAIDREGKLANVIVGADIAGVEGAVKQLAGRQ